MKDEDGKKPRRKGKTGRARTSKARALEPSDDIRLSDKITRSRKPGDPEPEEQLALMQSYLWQGIQKAGKEMGSVDLSEAKDINSLMSALQKLKELHDNLASTGNGATGKSIEILIKGFNPDDIEVAEDG